MTDQLQVSIPVATIKVGGQSAGIAESDLEEIVVDTTYNLPAMATIRLHDPKLKWTDGDTFALGKTLSITLGPPKSMKHVEPAEVFAGEIVALEPSFSALGTHSLVIRAYDQSHRLHYGTKTRTFLQTHDGEIARKIAQEAGLQTGTIIASAPLHEYIIQANMTDFEFLMMRARRMGCLFSVVNNKLNFHEPSQMQPGPVLEMGESLRSFSVRMSAARQSKEVVVRGWNYYTKEAVVGKSTPAAVWNENGIGKTGAQSAQSMAGSKPTVLTTLVPRRPSEANQIAKAATIDQEGFFTEADGVCYGHPGLVAGVQVELKFLGERYSGKYYVTEAKHIYNAAGYETKFTVAGRYPQTFHQLLNGTSNGTVEPGSIHGVVVGIVTSVKDPEDLGRVKVTFPWLAEQDDQNDSNWARIAVPSAGKNRGMMFLPELNDEVLVAFEHGNPNHPYIVGQLWNGKDVPPDTNTAAHTGEGTIHRMIVSRLGHRIVFDDSNSKKSILIEDESKKQSIFIDSVKGDITIKASGNMLIDVQRNLDIKVGGNMNIEVKANLTASATNIEATANTNIKLDAKAALEMKAVGLASLESSTAVGVLKGPAVNIEADGPAVMQGNPIMLN